MRHNNPVRPFSAGYFFLDADVMEHGGGRALVPRDYFNELLGYTKFPLLHVATDYYWAYPEHGVPGHTVVIPDKTVGFEEGDPVLMARDETAQRLISAGEKDKPDL